MTERQEPIQVEGVGNSIFSIYGYSADVELRRTHQKIRLPTDHPDGIAPMTINDEAGSHFHSFHKALDFMKNERQILILSKISFSKISFSKNIEIISKMLPEGSYIQHNYLNPDNKGAAAWVRKLQHQQQTEQSTAEDHLAKKKYLIADGVTASGFEAPAVIAVIYKYWAEMPMMYQRAKAKLVVYTGFL